MSGDGGRIFTTNGVSGTVSVIDTIKNEVIKTIEVGKFPWGVVVRED
jgi:YVTN family beta-propeller protein